MARKYNTPVEPECCEKCGKTIPPRYPLVEYDEYWCKGHTPPKRKRGRPGKDNNTSTLHCADCGEEIGSMHLLYNHEIYCKGTKPEKRKRGRPRKSVSGFAPLRLREKPYVN